MVGHAVSRGVGSFCTRVFGQMVAVNQTSAQQTSPSCKTAMSFIAIEPTGKVLHVSIKKTKTECDRIAKKSVHFGLTLL